jgi:heme oxygenase
MENPAIDESLDKMNTEVGFFIDRRFTNLSIEEQLYIASNSQIYSFWSELRDLLQKASEEVKVLKQKIKELENKNV